MTSSPFLSFFIVLLAALIVTQLFQRMKIPWVVSLIIGGVIIGPYGLGIFEPDTTITFFSNIGLIFLMFMAGTETQLSHMKGLKKEIILVGFFIAILPFLSGVLLLRIFQYPWQTAILLGIVFMSSAVALLVPMLQEKNILGSDLGKILISATMIVDAISLILLSVFLQIVQQDISIIQLISYPLFIIILSFAAWIIPQLKWLIFDGNEPNNSPDLFEKELRFIILTLVGFVVLFEVAGIHTIIAGFFAGMVLSQISRNDLLKAKLHAISYGFFVPVFFVTIGSDIDLRIFISDIQTIVISLAIIISLIASKVLGAWIAGRAIHLTNKQSLFLGFASIPQLSTSLAVAILGFNQGILDQQLLSAIVALSVVTSIIAPLIINHWATDVVPQQLEFESIPENDDNHQQKLL